MPATQNADLVYAAIKARIVSGNLDAGEILTESELAAEYGVSRSPIRAAAALLLQDGLLERRRGGYAIKLLTDEEIVDLFEARIILEIGAASSAAHRRTALDLARLGHVHQRAISDDVSSDQSIDLNRAFHEAVRAAAHNHAIIDLVARLDDQLSSYDSAAQENADDRLQTREEHERIINAIRDGDAESAGEAMGAHANRSRDLRIAQLAKKLDT